jgi:hypothetical protein
VYVRTYEPMQDGGDLSLGKPPDPTLKVLAKNFVCSDADVRAINPLLNVTGFVGKDTLQLTVGARVREAVSWIQTAEKVLHRRNRSMLTDQYFKEAFGTTPDAVPAWLASRESYGDVVRKRLQRAGEILAGGNIEYRSWGPGTCPECRHLEPYFGCATPGQYRICLGSGFWTVFGSEPETQTSTLVHEALHIYFQSVEHANRLNNANCYVRFVRRCNGIKTTPRLDAACPAAPP